MWGIDRPMSLLTPEHQQEFFCLSKEGQKQIRGLRNRRKELGKDSDYLILKKEIKHEIK
jgi:hypothetical protein